MKRVSFVIAVLAIAAGCCESPKNNQETITEDMNATVNEVAGRKNFDAAGMCYRGIGEEVGKAWGAGKVFAE